MGEDNADAHLKGQVMGREVVVAVTEGKLDFGPWEQIFYGEFDGRRRKRILVNPSTPRPKGRGLLGVDPERRFFTPPSKAGLGAAERVKIIGE